MKTTALIVAGGNSQRFGGDIPKQYLKLVDKPVLSLTIEKFEKSGLIDNIILVTSEDYMAYAADEIIDPYGFYKVQKVVSGGESRSHSVFNGLKAISADTELVAIHDGARPLVSTEDINRVIESAQKHQAAILATSVADTVKKSIDNNISETIDRSQLYLAQTPQVFKFSLIYDAYKKVIENSTVNNFTDDASLLEKSGIDIKIVEPTTYNFKITTTDDLRLAEMIVESDKNE